MPILSKKSDVILAVAIIFLITILIIFLTVFLNQTEPAQKQIDSHSEPSNVEKHSDLPPEEVYDRISGRYLLAGTIVWDREVESASYKDDGVIDYEYPFAGLSSYSPQDYDAWVTDLECPISRQDVPYESGHTLLEFNCRPEFLPYAKKYFEFFNLSNNHSDNSGRDKLEETRQTLNEAGIQYFGDPDPSYKNHNCEVVALPVKLWSKPKNVFETAHLPVAFCAWHYFYRLPAPGEIEVIEEYAQVMPVFAFLHMGAEYEAQADSVQQSIARRVIDAGAEFVIANNPHWVQNAEIYKDKLIVSSTGNFIFDQDFNEEVKRSASIVVEIALDYDESLERWLVLGPDCAAYQDDCLAKVLQEGLQKLDVEFKFDVLAGYLNNHQQVLAGEEIQVWVKDRLNWSFLFD